MGIERYSGLSYGRPMNRRMIPALDAAAIRAMTVRLVACRSVSPDIAGETKCAREIESMLAPALERGAWKTPDGRTVVWALAPGSTPTTVVLMGHYDTVGVGEFGALGDPAGEAVAFDPAALRARLLVRLASGAPLFSAEQAADLGEERDSPGTWLFGRGALDMKSGVAIGIAVVNAWAAHSTPPRCGVLFIATPDEENESAGMVAALAGLRRLRERRGLELEGALNLDTVHERAAYLGAMGKIELGCYVVGRPTHAGAPLLGVDAAEFAAGIVTRVTRTPAMIDEDATGEVRSVPPVALRLRDLKDTYNIQTAIEAWVEFNLITVSRPLAETLECLRAEVMKALDELLESHRRLAAWLSPDDADRTPNVDPATCVLTYAELCERAGLAPGDDPLTAPGAAGAHAATIADRRGRAEATARVAAPDPRAATLARLRELSRRAGLGGPAVVLFLLPPFYPHVAPGEGPLVRATREALAGERDVPVKPYYPLVSDACYAAWRAEPLTEVARQMPSLGREYTLPYDDARALDLDVVNLGPWGHDLHGLLERAHAGWTFEQCPRLVWNVLERMCEFASPGGATP